MNSQGSLGDTKQKILLLMLDGDATAEDLASRVDMNLSVVRRHLEDLASQGLVESSFRRAGKGRPSKYYSITVEGRGRISSKYDMVADLLTMAIETDGGGAKSKALYESAGRVLASSVGQPKDDESLLAVLGEFGFQPQLRKEGKRELVVSRNCPILKLAKKYPELTCDAFHTVFLRDTLKDQKVVLRQAIARGAPECIHVR